MLRQGKRVAAHATAEVGHSLVTGEAPGRMTGHDVAAGLLGGLPVAEQFAGVGELGSGGSTPLDQRDGGARLPLVVAAAQPALPGELAVLLDQSRRVGGSGAPLDAAQPPHVSGVHARVIAARARPRLAGTRASRPLPP